MRLDLHIRACASAERHRWPLWLAVMLGVGAALYFSLSWEPAAWMGWAFLGAALALGVAAIFAPRGGMVLALAAALALGFAAAKLRQQQVAAPVLNQELTLHLTGRVESVDPAARGVRLVIADLRSGGFTGFVPGRARITVMKGGESFRAGDGISLTARLLPPPPPSEPGDGDFGRELYFQRIGAVGFSFGAPIPAPLAKSPGFFTRLSARVDRLRFDMTARIRSALPGSTGAIASALITGERGGITDEDEDALRDAGLAHVLAIAGLHMALVGRLAGGGGCADRADGAAARYPGRV